MPQNALALLTCVCAHVCVCVPVHTCGLVYMCHVCTEARESTAGVYHKLSTSFTETGSITDLELTRGLCWLASEPSLWLERCTSAWRSQDSNSGPHAYIASSLLTELSPSPHRSVWSFHSRHLAGYTRSTCPRWNSLLNQRGQSRG